MGEALPLVAPLYFLSIRPPLRSPSTLSFPTTHDTRHDHFQTRLSFIQTIHSSKMSDQVQELLEIPSEFAKDGVQFVRRCTKPDQKEFLRLCQAVGVGFLIMGAVGYIVKLIHLPLNRVLVS